MDEKHYTIKDIARMAGVSAGTVDRVLHHRGEVSEASRQKIQKILDEIDYQPNMFAIGLAGKKKYNIMCLIPQYEPDSYWQSVAEGILRAASELKPFNVNVGFIYYEHSNAQSYKHACQALLEQHCDAVLIAPNFREETLLLADELKALQIPFAFIDVNVEDAGAVTYIGQDSRRSGYVAGRILMQEYVRDQEIVLFLSNYHEHSCEVQMVSRLEGFLEYINQQCDHNLIYEVMIDSNDQFEDKLDLFFKEHPNVSLGVFFNSRVFKVGEYLKKRGIKMKGLIGYDLLPKNVELLKEDYISSLIGQRPGMQGYCGIKALANKVVFKREIEPLRYMPIDILMKENIEYYVEIV